MTNSKYTEWQMKNHIFPNFVASLYRVETMTLQHIKLHKLQVLQCQSKVNTAQKGKHLQTSSGIFTGIRATPTGMDLCKI